MSRPRGSRLATVPAAILLPLAVVAAPAASQVVSGTVSNPDYQRPVEGAWVVLLDEELASGDSTTTDGMGRFRLAAPGPGAYALIVRLDGYLTVTERFELDPGETVELGLEMPLVSVAAARTIKETIDREAALQLPLEELCRDPPRPWEAGVVVGVTRDRGTLEPIAGALVTLAPPAGAGPDAANGPRAARSRVSTDAGTFWFCNVPPGRALLVARAEGSRPDTSWVTVRAGTISWSDALLRR